MRSSASDSCFLTIHSNIIVIVDELDQFQLSVQLKMSILSIYNTVFSA